ncbi:hypothetical protein [Rhodococcus chondri]|uniref:Lipoprotein n=1 Tax=Rhodococcus chondri TaxID=3065941 RepID=A0ABU7JTQ9_9NOCA|nr:hypothetical protein [Rhodococcus sp. CC-R104]MEE2033409.1 hypothetical protein [Rhodococcus sp. CC-R104]
MIVRVSSAAAVAAAALLLAGCGGSADGSEADTVAEATTTTTAATTTTVEPAPTSPSTTTVAPSTTPEPTETIAPPTTLVDVEYEQNESYYFTSPDGQFQCGIVQLPSRTEAGCEGVTDPVPPRPDNCVVNWGHGIRVQDTGPGTFLCSGGPVYLPVEGAAPALPAGSSLSELGYTCTTTAADVTCANDATGHGFTVAAGSNETF